MPIISLTTDFGLKDGNVGVMKGVIWSICPQAQIVDLSHLIRPQNIAEGALVLVRSAPYFPPGAIHVAVVDPGVGTARRPIAARLGEQFYVGPDNGLLSLLMDRVLDKGQSSSIVCLDRPQYWLPVISPVFHGRDIFAPVAAHLAAGTSLELLGTAIADPVHLQLLRPERTAQGWRAEIIHIDHFGNLSTSLTQAHFTPANRVTVILAGVNIHGLVDTFGQRSVGELVALFGSTGNLIVAQVNGNAAAALNAKVGDPVDIILESISD